MFKNFKMISSYKIKDINSKHWHSNFEADVKSVKTLLYVYRISTLCDFRDELAPSLYAKINIFLVKVSVNLLRQKKALIKNIVMCKLHFLGWNFLYKLQANWNILGQKRKL